MTELGLFGKIPAKGDFVRHNVVSEGARAFEHWVQESSDAIRAASGHFPARAIRAVFAGPTEAVVASLVPSQDQVGREFPLAVFAVVPVSELDSSFSILPLAYAPFLDHATSLGLRSAQAPLDQLKAGLAALPLPTPTEYVRARDLGERVLRHPVADEIHGRLFGTGTSQEFYAYQTFLTACQDAAQPNGAATVLDCPLRVDVDLFHWLELTRRAGAAPGRPSYFWVEDPAPRLLLALGSPPPLLLALLADPALTHQRLWPLTTQRSAAVQAAESAMAPVLAGIGRGAPLSVWLDTLAHRASAGTMR